MGTTTHGRVSDRVSNLRSPVVAQMLQRARALQDAGASLITLGRGEPDFDTPERICRAAVRALQRGETHYPAIQGIPELRVAVAEKLARENGLCVDPATEVLITTGGTMGLYLALMATVSPGDEVLLPDPIYDAYRGAIGLAGGRPVPVPSERAGDHFAVPVDTLRTHITSHSKALLLNTPWNPTGSVVTKSELESVGDLASEHNLFIIVDEVYENIVFEGHTHVSLAALAEELKSRTITVNSFSKTYAMTGWRLGYNVASEDLVSAMTRVYQQSSRGPVTFVQWAGVEALRGPQSGVQLMAQEYTRRRALLMEGLSDIAGVRTCVPEGTFFALVDIRDFGVSSLELADHLLNEGHLITIPGEAYGSLGEGHIRLSFAVSQDAILEGLARMSEALKRLSRTP